MPVRGGDRTDPWLCGGADEPDFYNVLLHMAVNSFSMMLVLVENGLNVLGMSAMAAAFSVGSFIMILLLIAAGIYFSSGTDDATGGRWDARTGGRHRTGGMCT